MRPDFKNIKLVEIKNKTSYSEWEKKNNINFNIDTPEKIKIKNLRRRLVKYGAFVLCCWFAAIFAWTI